MSSARILASRRRLQSRLTRLTQVPAIAIFEEVPLPLPLPRIAGSNEDDQDKKKLDQQKSGEEKQGTEDDALYVPVVTPLTVSQMPFPHLQHQFSATSSNQQISTTTTTTSSEPTPTTATDHPMAMVDEGMPTLENAEGAVYKALPPAPTSSRPKLPPAPPAAPVHLPPSLTSWLSSLRQYHSVHMLERRRLRDMFDKVVSFVRDEGCVWTLGEDSLSTQQIDELLAEAKATSKIDTTSTVALASSTSSSSSFSTSVPSSTSPAYLPATSTSDATALNPPLVRSLLTRYVAFNSSELFPCASMRALQCAAEAVEGFILRAGKEINEDLLREQQTFSKQAANNPDLMTQQGKKRSRQIFQSSINSSFSKRHGLEGRVAVPVVNNSSSNSATVVDPASATPAALRAHAELAQYCSRFEFLLSRIEQIRQERERRRIAEELAQAQAELARQAALEAERKRLEAEEEQQRLAMEERKKKEAEAIAAAAAFAGAFSEIAPPQGTGSEFAQSTSANIADSTTSLPPANGNSLSPLLPSPTNSLPALPLLSPSPEHAFVPLGLSSAVVGNPMDEFPQADASLLGDVNFNSSF